MNPRVLVVDDNEEILRLISAILLPQGLEIRTARDGASALTAVEQQLPDAILLDVMMPEMDGTEVLARLKGNNRTASIPVILLTARTQDEDVLTGYDLGADYYITKPFTREQLLYGVGLVLGWSLEHLGASAKPALQGAGEKRRRGAFSLR